MNPTKLTQPPTDADKSFSAPFCVIVPVPIKVIIVKTITSVIFIPVPSTIEPLIFLTLPFSPSQLPSSHWPTRKLTPRR